jgi:hypothetical protein
MRVLAKGILARAWEANMILVRPSSIHKPISAVVVQKVLGVVALKAVVLVRVTTAAARVVVAMAVMAAQLLRTLVTIHSAIDFGAPV